jgi:3-oxoacyl-[acyl-carrier-protein] synthase-3
VIHAQIVGIEYYLPETVLDNRELARLYPEWSAEQIGQKTGIRARHIAAPGETASDMAVRAAGKLFASGKAKLEEIDFILLCTQSPDFFLPTSACVVQHRLGIPSTAGALDFNLGCSGFIYGLALAHGLIESGSARSVLFLTAETYSKYMHPQDRSVRTLFGDGAAATILRGVETSADTPPWLGPFVFGTDGAGADALIVRSGAMRERQDTAGALPLGTGARSRFPGSYLFMDGPSILTFTLKAVPAVVKTLLARSGMRQEDIELFVFHQANQFMLEGLRKQLRIPAERFVINMADKGNTVSNTIPIALVDAQADGQLRPHQRTMLVGFGVGLSWGACLARFPASI